MIPSKVKQVPLSLNCVWLMSSLSLDLDRADVYGRLLGALAAAPALLLCLTGWSDGAAQSYSTNGATGHLPAGHLFMDRCKWQRHISRSFRESWAWVCVLLELLLLPVRTSLKATSTLVDSKADVSINIRPFFAEWSKGQVETKSKGQNQQKLVLSKSKHYSTELKHHPHWYKNM